MIPTIGRIVIFCGVDSHGVVEHPAVITHTYSSRDTRDGPVAVNLTVLLNGASPRPYMSVQLHESRADAVRHGACGGHFAYWPAPLSPDSPAALAAARPPVQRAT